MSGQFKMQVTKPCKFSSPFIRAFLFPLSATMYARPSRSKPASNAKTSIFYDPYTFQSATGQIITLRKGDTVKLVDNSLLRVKYFIQEYHEDPRTDKLSINVFIKGARYYRFRDCEDLGGFMVYRPREVYEHGRGHHHPWEVVQIVKLIKSNNPAFQVDDKETYLCKYIRIQKGKEDVCIRMLTECEADNIGRSQIEDLRMRNRFILGTSSSPLGTGRYTFGDAFCGIGGVSAGARSAGLQIKWAFDADVSTCHTYAENFPSANVMIAKVDHFLALKGLKGVDVLHLSPPCQAWSMAHTVAGQNDDANSASLFSVKELLLMARPRIATMEQVPGLMRKEDNKYS
jgi:hypothetical protein